MAEAKETPGVTIRTRKFIRNSLLNRRQMIIDVLHPNSGPPPRAELQAKLAATYKVKDSNQIFVYGFKTAFGGGKTTGFALIYDTLNDALNTEPKYRLYRSKLAEKVPHPLGLTRQLRRQLKNRLKKYRGKDKTLIRQGKAIKKRRQQS